uniref:COP9 signalosome complex subunit 1 n=1 Tax=Cryptococcus bacillisporus CA1280 TaxID=1296109 RepID=A0A0D0VHY5_CRYGA|nr:COP9 signalosome complex subunit 1 [Cryptococcus bacillisporus CA1280]
MTSDRSYVDILASIDTAQFDWSAYEGTYKGRALITRYTHLVNTCVAYPSPPASELAKTALLKLIPLVKSSTWDINTYLWAVSVLFTIVHPGQTWKVSEEMEMDKEEDDEGGITKITSRGIPPGEGKEEDGFPDERWITETRDTVAKEVSRLDVELRSYMSNLIKESIRLTQLAFAELAFKVGKVREALNSYAATREYSSTPQHHVDLGVGVVETCLAFNYPAPLSGHIAKLEATLDRLHPPPHAQSKQQAGLSTTASDLRERQAEESRSQAVRRSVMVRAKVGKGLISAGQKDWARAGRELGWIEEDEGGLGDWEGKQAISTSDLALLSAFYIFASSDRGRIRRALLDRATFKSQLDDSQGWIIDLIGAYVDANYGQVMSLLQYSEPILLLNPFLSSCTRSIISCIQTRSIIQYVQPFSTIHIQTMTQAFRMEEDKMLDVVEKLIGDGDVGGKIDLIDNILVMDTLDPRAEMFEKALKAGQKSAELAQASLLRMKLTEAGVMVNPHAESINSEISGKQQQQPLGPEATATTTTTALQVPETAMAEDHSAEGVVMHASGEPNGESVA